LIDADGKTVGRDHVWSELLSFYNSLISGGILTQ
jgi:hypothetical protein